MHVIYENILQYRVSHSNYKVLIWVIWTTLHIQNLIIFQSLKSNSTARSTINKFGVNWRMAAQATAPRSAHLLTE